MFSSDSRLSEKETTRNIEFRLCDKSEQSESSYLRNEINAMNTQSQSGDMTSFSATVNLGYMCKSNDQLQKDLEKLQMERQSLEDQAEALKVRLAESRKERSTYQSTIRTKYSYL